MVWFGKITEIDYDCLIADPSLRLSEGLLKLYG